MQGAFRDEIFSLCKLLKKNDAAQEITSLIERLSITNFSQFAQRINREFHGYLLLDDNLEEVNLPYYFKAEHLLYEDRILIEKGYKTIVRLIDLCLSDLTHKSPIAAKAMNPYSFYKTVKVSPDVLSILSDEELSSAVSRFKDSKIHKALMSTNFTNLFEKTDDNKLYALMRSIENEINQSLGNNTTRELRVFSSKLSSKLSNLSDIIFAFAILMFALKSALALSCRLLYRAMCGVGLFVLNDDNIINIEKNTATILCHFYKVMSLDFNYDHTNSDMGSLLLIDCNLPNDRHIHEFGMLLAKTINLASEFGQSAKYSFVTVNDEMIFIHRLTNAIMQNMLPVRKEKEH